MTTFYDSLLLGLSGPWSSFGDPTKRLYWLYCLSSLGLWAVVTLAQRNSPRPKTPPDKPPRSRYWNRSTQLDLKLLFTNSVIRAIAITPLVVPVTTITTATAAALSLLFDTPPPFQLSRSSVAVLYTLALFLVSDASRYGVHRLSHGVPLLWKFHRVHHSATSLTPLTLYRMHPVEIVLQETRRVLAIGLTTGVFLYLFGKNLNGYDVLGVNLFGFLFNLFGANLRHSNTWLSYGRWVEHLFISPAQHQVHHSIDPAHHHKNYGSALAIWDWLCGTLHLAPTRSRLQYGVASDQPGHTTLRDALLAKRETAAPTKG